MRNIKNNTGSKAARKGLAFLLIIILALSSLALTNVSAVDVTNPVEDLTPPELVEFGFSPTTINVSAASQGVNFTLRLTDNLSGVSSACWYLSSPSGKQSRSGYAREYYRISGDALDGVYKYTVNFPLYSEAGTWSVYYVGMSDMVGNYRGIYKAALSAQGFPTDVVVVGGPDLAPPELVEFGFSPGTIDVSSGPQGVNFTLRLADKLSGVSSACWYLSSPSGKQSRSGYAREYYRISGDALDGVYKYTVNFPQYSEAGTWSVYYVGMSDMVGNYRGIYKADLSALVGFSTDVEVISVPDDTEPPQLLEFGFSPTTIDVSFGPQKVNFTLRLTDNLSGVSSACWYLSSPSGKQSRSGYAREYYRISGDALDGVYKYTVTFPQYSEAGTWSVYYVGMSDMVGNYRGIYKADLSAQGFTTAVEVTENQPPVANANGPYKGYEGSPITFNASASSDPDNDSLKYRWDFDNDSIWDTAYSTDPTASFTWDDDYLGVVVVEAYDGKLTDNSSTTVTVNNVAPTVSIDAIDQPNPSFILSGDVLTFTGSFTDPGVLDTHTICWDFGDGTAGSGIITTHAYNSIGTYTVTLTVTDDDGGIGTDTCAVTVLNRLPVANAGSDQTVYMNVAVSFDASGSYDSDGSIASYAWDFGDSATGTGVTTTHTYTDDGVYTVTLTVTDDDGATATDTCVITVLNKAPVANAGLDQTVYKNELVQFDASQSYDPDGTIVSYSWDFGDWTTGSGITVTHTYTNAGTYTVGLTVTDDDGATATDTCAITVLNRAPTIAPIGEQTATVDTEFILQVTGSDPDGDSLIYSVSGLPPGSSFDPTTQTFSWIPEYDQIGSYNLTFYVFDGASNWTVIPNSLYINEESTISTCTIIYGSLVINAPLTITEGACVIVYGGYVEVNDVLTIDDGTLVVSDGSDGPPDSLSDSEDVVITVTNITVLNRAPVIDSYSPESNPTIKEEESQMFSIIASDPDNDIITINWYLDGALVASGATYTFTADFASAGSYEVKVVVSDGELSASHTWVLTVTNVNRAPVISAMDNPCVVVGTELDLQVSASDSDGDTLTFSDDTELFEIDSATGSISFMPAVSDVGTHIITITVSDGSDSASTTFTLTVLEPQDDEDDTPAQQDAFLYALNITLRVTGKPGNTVTLIVKENNVSIAEVTVVRKAGDPNEQAKTVTVNIYENRTYEFVLKYNSGGGDNPIKIKLEINANGFTATTTLNLNAQQDVQEVILSLEELLAGNAIHRPIPPLEIIPLHHTPQEVELLAGNGQGNGHGRTTKIQKD